MLLMYLYYITFTFTFLKNLDYCECGKDRVSWIKEGQAIVEPKYEEIMEKYSTGTGFPDEDPVCSGFSNGERKTICADVMKALGLTPLDTTPASKFVCYFYTVRIETIATKTAPYTQMSFPCFTAEDPNARYLSFGYSRTLFKGFNLFAYKEGSTTPSPIQGTLKNLVLTHYIDLYANNKIASVSLQKLQKLVSKVPKTAKKCVTPPCS